MRRLTTLGLGLCVATLACKDQGAGGPPLRLGVAPAVDMATTQAEYEPLVSELSAALDRPIALRVAANYEALERDIVNDGVDVAQVSSYLYVSTTTQRTRAGRPTQVIAQEQRRADSRYYGVFVVRADSPAKSLADLKGKKIVYVAKTSSAGYYYPRMRLRDFGFDPATFFSGEEFAGSHDAVIAKLKAGQGDVGAVSELSSSLSGLRVIERTAAIPDDAMVALSGVNAADLAKLSSFFLAAHTRPGLANFFVARGLERYASPDVQSYEPQRQEMVRTAGALGDAQPQ